MSTVDANAVASLRARTGVSMMECKKALDEAGGDEEKAIDILKQKGASQVAKKADREQGEGLVFSAEEDGKAALIKLHCETDFVARDDGFQSLGQELADTLLHEGMDAATKRAEEKIPEAVQKLGENISVGEMQITEASTTGVYVHTNGKIGVIVGLTAGKSEKAKDLAMHAAAMNPLYVKPEDVPAKEVEKEKGAWKEQLLSEGKPEDIIEKIMMGKEKKFREEHALLTQEFVKDPSMTVGSYLGADGDVIEYVRFSI